MNQTNPEGETESPSLDTQNSPFDVFVIGGGINGCGIARDAVGRGLKVGLAEMNDLASGTSSWSTKLIHGGLRYLEHYEFRLVRESLMERELLWGLAPHIIRPLRFVLPHHKGLRPAWLLRLGLFLYDHLGGRKRLPATRVLDMRKDAAGSPLQPLFTKAFEYSDCWVDDARLVVLNARDAADRGAKILTRRQVKKLSWDGALWSVELLDTRSGSVQAVQSRVVVNAAGPWVDQVLGTTAGRNARNVRLVQGSHIVVRKLFDHERCYIFQHGDGRIIFAIPYEQDFTLIGTTDRDFDGDPGGAKISAEEVKYLCEAVSGYFRTEVKPEDMVWDYSGVRPLFDDGASKAQEATRDYVLRESESPDLGPMINIFGGKITTFRRLALDVMLRVEAHLGVSAQPWTHTQSLPGGDFPVTELSSQIEAFQRKFPFLPQDVATRLYRAYGTKADGIMGSATSMDDLGEQFGHGLSQAEVEFLMREEWAISADDVLWRRSKLGLRLTKAEASRLEAFMQQHGNAVLEKQRESA